MIGLLTPPLTLSRRASAVSKGAAYTPGQVEVTPPSTTRVWPVT